MLFLPGLLCSLLVLHHARAEERCCEKTGCFDNDGIFGHLPLPVCPEDMDLKFSMFTQDNMDSPEMLTEDNIPSVFRPNRRTMFLIHGWYSSDQKEWVQLGKKELLIKEDANVVLVDWRKGAAGDYGIAASNTRTVGAHIGYLVDMLNRKAGSSGASMWCIGFSLGGQVCGHAGRSTKFGRISGIDPAGSMFVDEDENVRLNPSCADFVDVIHTSSVGSLDRMGHKDFYPNKGLGQPGCGDAGCDHQRAPMLFIETIKKEDCMVSGHNCTDSNQLPGSCKGCPGGVCAAMGYPAKNDGLNGMFYLKTTGSQPYCDPEHQALVA